MDKALEKLSENECFFLRNHERYLTLNGRKRGTLGKTSPLSYNTPACLMNKPAGESYSIGEYYEQRTNELYSWVYNSNAIHYVQRLNGDGECEIVYVGCLRLSAEPQHSIDQFKAYLKIDKICSNTPGGIRKTLIFTDGINDIGAIDVEASIYTDSFNPDKFPFFGRCTDPCELIRLCVPDPCGCLKGEFVAPTPADALLTNLFLDVAIKFSYRHIYYDGIRGSIYADPTEPFYQQSKKCFEQGNLSRCVKLRVPIGNALVDKIEIVYWKNGEWFLYDTVEKYKKYNTSQQYWFERELAEDVQSTFSEDDCAFDYFFCHDKQCGVIDLETFNRVYNPIPREAQFLFAIGIGEDKDALAFGNYKKGNCRVDAVEVKKISIAADCDEDDCQTELTEIVVRAIVHNTTYHRNQPIYRLNGPPIAADNPDDTAYFGGLNDVGNGNLELTFGQQFNEKTRNFICYIEGTEYWAEMKQWKAHPGFTQIYETGTLAGLDDDFQKRRWRRAIRDGEYFYQECKIKVPKGTRGILRLSSHESTTNDQDTSTFVIGTISDLTTYRGNADINSTYNAGKEEILINGCNGGTVIVNEVFVIQDNAVDNGLTSKASAHHGYLKDKSGLPIEGAVITLIEDEVKATSVTDHNGFYHFYVFPGINDDQAGLTMEARVERDCFSLFTQLASDPVGSAKGANLRHDMSILDEAYQDNFYATVKAKVKDCAGNPVAGIIVAITGSKYKITAADGYATFKIRNYQTRNRIVSTYVMNTGGCLVVDCNDDCYPCMPKQVEETPACYQAKPTVSMDDSIINMSSILNNRGLKAGGRYPIAVVAKGSCGRQSAAYLLQYIDIEKAQAKGKQSFCNLSYADTGSTWPDWVKCVDILRGENINPFELQWIVDDFKRTDDGKIVITIQSLVDYNEKYLFKTNTVYQWLANDRVEFIKNGDNKFFTELINYQTISPFHDELISGKDEDEAAVDFFNQIIIQDDGKLDKLKKGAIIELQRDKVCKTEPVFFSICASIPVVNNRLLYTAGTFTTFDTYYVNRMIGEYPLQRFEHHSPSDFWGTRLTDAGRPYFENKYENERRYGRNITISPPNEINRFGETEKTINPDSHGDIIAVVVQDNKIGLVISENDNSLIQIGDDLLRVSQDGVVRAATSDQIISDAQPKLSGTFGCPYEIASSIVIGDGFVTWYDGCNLIKHDFRQAVAVDEGKCNTFFAFKGQELFTHNGKQTDPLNKIRVSAGINYGNGVIHYTFKTLRDPGYSNEIDPFLKRNETILFDPAADDFVGFASFTAERYGYIDLFDGKGCAFISYFNGVPYIHQLIPAKFNEFFGIACDWMIGVVLNMDSSKIKEGLSIEMQSGPETFFYAKEITTENINFKSEIPPSRWVRDRDKWNASFLGNINSRGGLYGDDKARGYFTKILFVRDNTNALQYNTVNSAKRTAYSELDQILFKFKVIEQSGFTENV